MSLYFRYLTFALISILHCPILAQESDPFSDDSVEEKVKEIVADKVEKQFESKSLEEKLKTSLVPPRFEEVPFSEIAEELTERTGAMFYLTDSARDDALMGDDIMTFNLPVSMPFEQALSLMLEPRNATFVPNGDVLKIISLDDADDPRYHFRKVFDIRNLIQLIVDARMKAYSNDNDPPREWEIRMIVEEEIVDLLKQSVATESWDDYSGDANVVVLEGIAIVRNRFRHVREIENLLREIKSTLTRQAPTMAPSRSTQFTESTESTESSKPSDSSDPGESPLK